MPRRLSLPPFDPPAASVASLFCSARVSRPRCPTPSFCKGLQTLALDRRPVIDDFPTKLHAKIMKILLEYPVPIRDRRPALPDGLAGIIHRELARDPQARYTNVREMRRALALHRVIKDQCISGVG